MSTTSPSGFASPTTTEAGQNALALIGRILVAYLFIPAGVGKLMGFGGTVAFIGSVGLPLPQLGAVIAILVEVGLGIALLLGYRTRWTAIIMAVFTVASAIFFHNFWSAPEAQHVMQQIHFGKNMAIAGGLLAIAAFGPGRFSIDKR